MVNLFYDTSININEEVNLDVQQEEEEPVRMFFAAETGCLFENETSQHINFSKNITNFCYPDCTELYFYETINELLFDRIFTELLSIGPYGPYRYDKEIANFFKAQFDDSIITTIPGRECRNSKWGMAFRNGEFPENEKSPGIPNEISIFAKETSADYPLANITFNVTETHKFHEFERATTNYSLGMDSEYDLKLCRLNQVLGIFYNFLYPTYENLGVISCPPTSVLCGNSYVLEFRRECNDFMDEIYNIPVDSTVLNVSE
ncbi:Oidioi.mRNA.OKI2018_I69.chr1.g2184.t1.cds [Oikopleura dioica]|uniref:Oidioi.mRNA.OKI2018_I69.chr1.g2184.t1.cds n=1 Tax=Oikopleura dioica TaxID=34765 RepID=A0ABN7SX86_OIKDI|nr:Oidioi.mRNA.OKI2018_I69.chr1.g2184.t1.cds [Oikopleura dioica]